MRQSKKSPAFSSFSPHFLKRFFRLPATFQDSFSMHAATLGDRRALLSADELSEGGGPRMVRAELDFGRSFRFRTISKSQVDKSRRLLCFGLFAAPVADCPAFHLRRVLFTDVLQALVALPIVPCVTISAYADRLQFLVAPADAAHDEWHGYSPRKGISCGGCAGRPLW